MNFNLILSKLGISAQITQDVSLIIFTVLISFVYGMLLGKHKLMTVLVNIYISFAIITVIPANLIMNASTKILVFLSILVGLTIMSRRFFDITFSGAGSAFIWRVFLISFLEIGLILSIILSLMTKKEALSYISSNAYYYLVTGWAPLIWMSLPLAFMFFVYRKGR